MSRKFRSFLDLQEYNEIQKSFSNQYFDNSSLVDDQPLNSDKLSTYQKKIEFNNHLASYKINEYFFTNKLENARKSNPLNTNISNLLFLENKLVDVDNIPFFIEDYGNEKLIIDGDLKFIKKVKRYKSIFKENDENILLKIYKTKMKTFLNDEVLYNQKGDIVRVFYIDDFEKDVLTVLLIDIYHLVADSEIQYKQKFKEVKNYQDCITMCKSHYIKFKE